MKGINLGVAKPGTFPGELAATREDYARWFPLIRAAGFNTIRIYTLHFPHFYDELNKFNLTHPNNPLFLLHGVWLEEELEGYTENLFFIDAPFENEIQENISAVHGDVSISQRRGKAYGTYTTDISPWVLGYIIGREVHPPEVAITNTENPSLTNFSGNYLSIDNINASEVFIVKHLDELLTFEQTNYGTQRPVSFSSWPTQDPISHPFEKNRYEDSTSIDLSSINYTKAKAGLFISYHAYPYYPDFVSNDPNYASYSDYKGQNSYLGYLTDLKNHYQHIPLIIAEFGAPSSWGVAHYATNGIHHGGYDEKTQGENAMRMLKSIETAGSGGGIVFSWIDEWFKRTWITDYLDFDVETRILWHNITAAEQNFGLLKYAKEEIPLSAWDTFVNNPNFVEVKAQGDYTFFKTDIELKEDWKIADSLWIGIDTYDANLGESILPNKTIISNRAEFALLITSFSAELFVTEAYDLFGKFHHVSSINQKYQSTVSDGGKWFPVRWKNNSSEQEVQFIGQLKVNRLGLPKTSLDAVTLGKKSISIRIPWQLLQFTNPSKRAVIHDDRATPETETLFSDGMSLSFSFKNSLTQTSSRFLYETWGFPSDYKEYQKESYKIIEAELPTLFDSAVAKVDSIEVVTGIVNEIDSANGVLKNDLSLSGNAMFASLVQAPKYGILQLSSDGSFMYQSVEGLQKNDSFTYRVNQSEPVTVVLNVVGTPKSEGFLSLYPNPSTNSFTIKSKAVIKSIEIYNSIGQKIRHISGLKTEEQVDIKSYSNGIYFAIIFSGNDKIVKRFTVIH